MFGELFAASPARFRGVIGDETGNLGKHDIAREALRVHKGLGRPYAVFRAIFEMLVEPAQQGTGIACAYGDELGDRGFPGGYFKTLLRNGADRLGIQGVRIERALKSPGLLAKKFCRHLLNDFSGLAPQPAHCRFQLIAVGIGFHALGDFFVA